MTTTSAPTRGCRALAALWVGLLVCGPSLGAEPSSAPATTPAFNRQLAQLINAYRREQGLDSLAFTNELAALAGEHSDRMALRQRLSHDGFDGRFRQVGSRHCVENVGWNFATPEGLFDGWRMSPTHLPNLLAPDVSRMGIGVAARYVTFLACR